MAEKKNPVKAPTFKQTVTTDYEMDRKTEKKFARVVPRELKFSRLTPNPNSKLLNLTKSSGRIIRSSRMLIYEDCSDEDEAFRSTPPNIQERTMGTPGAPIKSRKDIEKKVLRPKKLVYNDKGNDHRSEDLGKENQFYQITPKKSGIMNNEDDDDFYYEKFMKVTAIIPRKIIPIREDVGRAVFSVNREVSAASTSSRSVQQDRKKCRKDGNRRNNGINGSRKSSKTNDLNYNKENNALQLEMERNIETEESSLDSLKNRCVKNATKREELTSSFKTGELTHFRI